MRTMFRIFAICCLVGMSIGVPIADAQQGIVNGPRGGGNVRLLEGGRGLITPSRVWFEANLADDGFGYEGPYVTLGSKTHFADDFLDGRWLAEGQANLSLDSGGFFANFGIQRVYTLKNPGADIVLGGWIDYDGDDVGDFGHKFWQVSANAAIKTQRWDLIANGYLPFGTTDFTVGNPGAEPSFFENRIVLQAGINSALRGFDLTLRTRPTRMAQFNGHVDIGTYGYESETVDFFFGSRFRIGAQFWKGWQSTVELNYDDRFEFTGALQMAYVWGTGHRGTAAGLGNDLERTVRNDHITRFRRDPVFAIDPDTGRAFNVVHVDNSTAAGGLGTFESRFDSLADAQAASGTDDIIFVHSGDGTDTGYDTGIVLQDRQMLLGDGVEHLVQDASGNFFRLPNDTNGVRPVFSNIGGAAITLAQDNTIRGIDVQGFDIQSGTPLTQFGIIGNDAGNVTIENTNVQDVLVDGIRITNTTGNILIQDTTVSQVAQHGINLNNVGNATATHQILNTTVTEAQLDGIRFDNYDATTINIAGTTATLNQGHGINMIGHRNAAGTGATFTFQETTTTDNSEDGIRLEDAQGTQAFLGIVSNNNTGNGVELIDVRQVSATQQTLFTAINNTPFQVTGNDDAGIFNNLGVANATQRLNITGATATGNSVGLEIRAEAAGASLTTNIINNTAIAANTHHGIILRSKNGSNHEVAIRNTVGLLNMQGNGAATGNGISMFVDNGVTTGGSTLIADIDGIDLGTTGNSVGIFGGTQANGTLIADINNVQVTNAGTVLQFVFANNDLTPISRIHVEDVRATATTGTGLAINVGALSSADFTMVNGNFQDVNTVQTTAVGTNVAVSGRLRLDLSDNTFNGFGAQGVTASTFGAGLLLANIEGNTITNNGPLITGIGTPPHANGLEIFANGNSRIDARIVDNTITGNFQQGVVIEALPPPFPAPAINNSTINVLLDGNVIAGNDQGGPPVTEQFLQDFRVTSTLGSNICVALTTNTFTFAQAITGAGVNPITLELDGLTNGPGFPSAPAGAIVNAGFGTTCEPAIQAQETTFTGFGF